MQLSTEIDLLNKIYNTLGLIPTRGQDTLHMANCLNALAKVAESLEEKNVIQMSVEIPINEIPEEQEE